MTKASCFTCWSWRKLRVKKGRQTECKAEATISAIKAVRDSMENASSGTAWTSSGSTGSSDEELHVSVVGSNLFAKSSSIHSRSSFPNAETSKAQNKREFVWVDIDPNELEKIPQEVVRKALEQRNTMLPMRTLKAKDDDAVLHHNPCSIWSPPATNAEWDNRDLVTPRGSASKPLGRVSSLGQSSTSAQKKNTTNHWLSSPKFSSSSPGVFARNAANDEANFRSAGKDDEKIETGDALLRPSDLMKKTPRGQREADRARRWGDCPLTMDTIKVPVRAGDGKIYERWAIEKWLSENANRSPLTNVVIDPKLTLLTDEDFVEEENEVEEAMISGSNLGLAEDDEGNFVDLNAWATVKPLLLNKLSHIGGSVLCLTRLSIPSGTRKGQQLTFDYNGEPFKAVYNGALRDRDHEAVFALVEFVEPLVRAAAAEVAVQQDEIPGGLSGIRARMAQLGHSVGPQRWAKGSLRMIVSGLQDDDSEDSLRVELLVPGLQDD